MTKRNDMKEMVGAIDALTAEPEPLDQKGRTRARILRAATQLFQRNGYRRTSVDDVAREAGIAKGTVYVHFKTKSELLFHAILEEKKKFVAPFRELLSAQLAPADRLRRYVELMFLAIPAAPLSSRLMSGDREITLFLEDLPPELRAQVAQTQDKGMHALLAGVGEMDRLPPEEQEARIKTFMGIVYSSVALMENRIRGGLSVEEYARQLAKILVDGIGAP